MLNILFLIGGLALILFGANWLTDGASAVARRLGVSDLIIGLTIVALGTSAPELAISIISAVDGNAPLAIGNVVGSNIFNILVIIGIVAMLKPIVITRSVMTTEIPLVTVSALVLLTMGCGTILDGAPERLVTRVDGILLLIMFGLFLRYMFATARTPQPTAAEADPAALQAAEKSRGGTLKATAGIVGGLAALVFGGDKFVDGASGLASAMGVSDAVIGLTIVAAGTSLPELATSIVAARKGENGMAIGNVIGSCIFNILLILGTAATITPLPFGGISTIDLLVMTGASVMFWVFGWFFRERTITRVEGALMVLSYVGYTAWLIASL
nr:calcium/sodium antiporter [Bacteroides sp.]